MIQSAQTGVAVLNPAADPEQRRKGIGGSDIAVILGLSPYKTPLDLYLEKRGLWQDEHASEAAHWGTVMEPVLAREYVRRFGTPVLRREPKVGDVILYPDFEVVQDDSEPQAILGTLVHPEYSWARGHLDGVGLTKAGDPSHACEFKTADLRLAHLWGEPDTDQVPEAYLVQVMWYLMLAGLEVAHIAVLLGGNRFTRYVVERDEQLIGIMLEHAAAFWEMVVRGDPPAPEPGECGKESLSRLYPTGSQGKELDATPALLELAEELHRIRDAAKRLDERKTTIENDLKLVMGEAARLNLGPKSYISWTNNKDSKKPDWKAVAEAAGATPELIAEHTIIKPGPRVFRCQGLDKLFGEEG